MYVSHKYRLWGVDGNLRTLKHSALGSVIDWVTSLDAGSYDLTNAKGPITAIGSYLGVIIVWTANSMHEIHGSEPNDFSILDVCFEIGCLNNSCHCECNGVLYFADKNGIYAYSGGQAQLISEPIRKYFTSGAAGYYYSMESADNKVYFIISQSAVAEAKCFLIYDTRHKKWHRQGDSFYGLVNLSNTLYGQDASKKLDIMNTTSKTGLDNSTAISYSFWSKMFNNPYLDQSVAVNEVWLKHWGTGTATLSVAYSTLGDTGTAAANYTTFIESTNLTHSTYAIKQQTFLTTTNFGEQPWYHLYFHGTGYKVINSIQLNHLIYGDDE